MIYSQDENDVFFDDFALESVTMPAETPSMTNTSQSMTPATSDPAGAPSDFQSAQNSYFNALNLHSENYPQHISDLSLVPSPSQLSSSLTMSGGLRRTQTVSPLPMDSFECMASQEGLHTTVDAARQHVVQDNLAQTSALSHSLSAASPQGLSMARIQTMPMTQPIAMPVRTNTVSSLLNASPAAASPLSVAHSPVLLSNGFHSPVYAQPSMAYIASPATNYAASPQFAYANSPHAANLYSQSLPMTQHMLLRRSASQVGSPRFSELNSTVMVDPSSPLLGDSESIKSQSSSQLGMPPLDKKERNRLAAERCRKKKAELIHQLSLENQLLRHENADLAKVNLLLEQKLDYLISILASYGISIPK
jgi:hypothetical protein